MKKLFFAVMTLLLFSCPNDDDNSPLDPIEDQILGTWKYHMLIEDGIEQTLDSCEKELTLIFDSDAVFTLKEYQADTNGDCVIDYEGSGTWENADNDTYLITLGTEVETEEILFEGDTFYVEYTDDYGTPNDTSDDQLIRQVYLKQESS